MSESSANNDTRGRKAPKAPVLGVGDEIGAGDSHLVADILPTDLADVAFDRMKEEVGWKTMYHRGKISLLLPILLSNIQQEAKYRDL